MTDPSRSPGWPQGRPQALAFLPRFLFDAGGPRWRYVLLAWPLVALPSLALNWLVATLAPNLAGPEISSNAPLWMVVVGVVIVSPFLETLLMTLPIWLFNRWFGPVAAVVGSALLWGAAHSLEAGRWGLIVWWPFLIFSIAYLTWRGQGYWRAVGIVFAVHALNNAGPMAVTLATR